MIKERKDKVAAAMAKNPLASVREVAKETGIPKSAVHRAVNSLVQDGTLQKDSRIVALTDQDFNIMLLAGREISRRIEEEPKKLKVRDLNESARESAKRYQIFRGEVTDKKGGLKTTGLNSNQLDTALKDILKDDIS